MATTDKRYTLSSTSKGPYDFEFPYLNTKDVQVTLNGTRLIPIEEDSVNYKFTRQTTQITLVDTPSVGDKLRIYRSTDDTNLSSTFYPGSAIKSGDLNDNFTQNLYTTQENTNDALGALASVREWDPTLDNGNGDWKTAFAKADDAVTTADTANEKSDTAKLATDSLVATNSGTAQNPVWVLQGDGSSTVQNNKGVLYAVAQADQAVYSAQQANNTAASAVSTADDAYDNAVRQAGVTPSGGADSAIQIAETAETNATNALNNSVKQTGVTPPGGANAAITIAEDAYDNAVKQAGVTPSGGANAAITIAENAETLANTANDNSVKQTGVTPPGGANAAITIAETADATATAANTKANDVEDTVELYVADSNGLRGGGTTHGQTPDTDPRGVKYAVDTATSAANSVLNSEVYKVSSNLTTLTTDGTGVENFPLTGANAADDGEKVQIADSTGISLSNGTWTPSYFSGVTNFPNGFDGHSQLTLKVKVVNGTPGSESYVAQEYYANDPEARYGEDRKIIVENNREINSNFTIQTTMNAHSVGPVTIGHDGTNPYTVTIPQNSTWLIS